MAYIASTRQLDNLSEKAINTFLSKFFYNKLFKEVRFETDKAQQIAGVDVTADGLLIDNKAMSSPNYINNPKNTFILELLVHSDICGEYLGWFLNPDIVTTHYLFVWIPEANVPSGGRITDSRQIKKLEVMLVDKSLMRHIIETHCSNERLLQVAHNMVAKDVRNMSIRELGNHNCPYFVYSNQLNEKPVNLVVPKNWLKWAAIKHCYVTDKEIVNIP